MCGYFVIMWVTMKKKVPSERIDESPSVLFSMQGDVFVRETLMVSNYAELHLGFPKFSCTIFPVSLAPPLPCQRG